MKQEGNVFIKLSFDLKAESRESCESHSLRHICKCPASESRHRIDLAEKKNQIPQQLHAHD